MTAPDRERLSAYLDGELGPAERAAVERELASSEPARLLLAELAALEELAHGLSVEAPEGYFEALPARVRARLVGRAVRPRRRPPSWAWAAAAALAVAALAPLILTRQAAPQLAEQLAPAAAGPEVAGRDRQADAAAVPREPSGGLARSPATPEERPAAAAPPPAESRRSRPEPVATAAGPTAASAPVPLATPAPAAVGGAGPREPSRTAALEAEAGAAIQARPQRAAAKEAAEGAPSVADEASPPPAPPPAAAAVATASARRAAPGFAVGPDAARFTTLAERQARTAADARRLREDWREFVAVYPESPLVDEARVRTIEAGVEAFRLGDGAEDRELARRDAEAYLQRDDAVQPGRTRNLLAALSR